MKLIFGVDVEGGCGGGGIGFVVGSADEEEDMIGVGVGFVKWVKLVLGRNERRRSFCLSSCILAKAVA